MLGSLKKIIKNFVSSSTFDENEYELNLSRLSELKVNPFDYRHEDFYSPYRKLTLEDELNKIICNSLSYRKNGKDEAYVSRTDYLNGSSSLTISYVNQNDRNIKNIVDKFVTVFGKDHFDKYFFDINDYRQSIDSDTIKKYGIQPTRWWFKNKIEIRIIDQKKENNVIVYVIVNKEI